MIGSKIRIIREENGLSQKDFAKKFGISYGTLQSYEYGETQPKANFLKSIAEYFNIDISFFYEKKCRQSVAKVSPNNENFVVNMSDNLSTNRSNLKESQEETNVISIPYFEDTYASAGGGVINYDEAPVIMDFDEEFLRKFLHISGNIANIHIINARGDSMEPTITNGELLFINPMQNESGIIGGCIYIISYDGDIYVKRIEKNPVTKAITLFSDNDKYEPIVIEKHNLAYCHIMGRVVSHMKKA